jgi:hypothetical protein
LDVFERDCCQCQRNDGQNRLGVAVDHGKLLSHVPAAAG